MCSTQSGDREVDFFFIVWSCDEKESFIKLREIVEIFLLFVAALCAEVRG